jgi:hypothetical protein
LRAHFKTSLALQAGTAVPGTQHLAEPEGRLQSKRFIMGAVSLILVMAAGVTGSVGPMVAASAAGQGSSGDVQCNVMSAKFQVDDHPASLLARLPPGEHKLEVRGWVQAGCSALHLGRAHRNESQSTRSRN